MFSEFGNSDQIQLIATDGLVDFYPQFLSKIESQALFDRIHMAETDAGHGKTPVLPVASAPAKPKQPESINATVDVSTDDSIEQQFNAELSQSDEENLLPAAKQSSAGST